MTLPQMSALWETSTIGDACHIEMGQAPSGESYNKTDNGIPLIAGAGDLGTTTPQPSRWTTSPTKIGRIGDIVLCVRATIGDLNWADKEYCYGRGVAGIRPKHDELSSEFLFYWIDAIRTYLLSLGRGATFKQISKKSISGIPLPYPPPREQRRIVARIKECMARIDEIETLRGETLQEYVALQTALLGAVIEPKEWPSMKIGNLVTTTRNGRSISTSNEGATGFVLSLSAVREVNLNPTAKKPIVLPPNILEKYQVRDGDVFVSRSNTQELVGLASVVTENVDDCIYPDLLIKLTPNTEIILPRFLAYALRIPSARAQIRERASGTSQSMVKISGARLKDVEIPVPPLEAQVRLIERLDLVHDRASDLLMDLKAPEISQLRESILRKAFAGEL